MASPSSSSRFDVLNNQPEGYAEFAYTAAEKTSLVASEDGQTMAAIKAAGGLASAQQSLQLVRAQMRDFLQYADLQRQARYAHKTMLQSEIDGNTQNAAAMVTLGTVMNPHQEPVVSNATLASDLLTAQQICLTYIDSRELQYRLNQLYATETKAIVEKQTVLSVSQHMDNLLCIAANI